MPVTRAVLLGAAAVVLALVWFGPLPDLAPHRFSAHMTMHMAVVAVAAPLVALGLAGGRFDPTNSLPAVFSGIPASVVELIVVWAWHAPALHHAARASAAGLALEQSMFLLSGFWVWMSAVGGERGRAGNRTGTGVVALLLTSMHMTLLGALLALSPRPLYAHAESLATGRTALDEQHLGGAIMLLVGGIVYLVGGLWLSSALLQQRAAHAGEVAQRRSA